MKQVVSPIPTRRQFLRNAWYVAGFSEELEPGVLLGRTILSQSVLLYRDEEGRAAAIGNICPHRFVPLSRGRLIGSEVHCGYHGLAFDRTGHCVHNPHGKIGKIGVPAFPIAEKQGLLWVWMGDSDRADEARIPVFDNMDRETHHIRAGYLHGRANYELMTDNILDLSHIEFLHPALGTEAVRAAEVTVEEIDGIVRTTRRMINESLPRGLATVYGVTDQIVDRTMSVTWQAPSHLVLGVNVSSTAHDRVETASTQTLHLFTPETESSTHYFYVGSLSRSTADSETADKFATALANAFVTEDKPMIDAQAEVLGDVDLMSLRPALLRIDKAPVLARRKLAALIAAESL